ncbi:MAG TPA: alpha/beta hydrolase [Solirubrobacterales bacterium]|nr:alpha/beta hydrolase [Solirubrobacterales bacterium]
MIRPRRIALERGGVHLVGREWGDAGPTALLLHGLAGWSGEWSATASWLARDHRVVAFDARGHGESERLPADVSRAAHVADAVAAIERLELGPCALVGQSLGGLTAMLMAAERPDLARSLIVVEAMPATPDTATIAAVERSLAEWPVPFATRREALDFFDARGRDAETWADGLERRPGGWWPRFDPAVMVRTLVEAPPGDHWDEWERIRCPKLVVRGENGDLPLDIAERMTAGTEARLVTIPGAGHEAHLDRPEEWRHALVSA